MRTGVDEELITLLSRISPIITTYAGGVRSTDDLAVVKRCGAGKIDITVGSALDLFGGVLSYREVVRWIKEEK
jgi:phosphoribosylformimino-5-aminoimidazole carboxamide ribotide isomerase